MKRTLFLFSIVLFAYTAHAQNWGQPSATTVNQNEPSHNETHVKKAMKAKESKPIEKAAEPLAPARDAAAEASTPASNPLKFSGYFDVRFSDFSADKDPNVPNDHAESGFGLEDGAFYLNYENEKLTFLIDIAFRHGRDGDLDSSATTPNASSNNNLALGVDKSQMYAKYKVNDFFVFDVGQFDTLYGVELNDSKDRVFGKTGLVYDGLLPVTHTGVMLEYARNGFAAKAFSANPNNKGNNGTSTNRDNTSETGVALGYSNEMFRTQLGYMTRRITKANQPESGDRNLLDFTAGATFGNFTIDMEYANLSDPSKDTLTATTNDKEDAGQGIFLLATYKCSDEFLVGVRAEQIKDDPAGASIDNANSYGVSVHYKVQPDFELRAEYIGYSYEAVDNTDWDNTRFSAAALVSF